MMKLDKYVTTAEAAYLVGVSSNTLGAWAEAGSIPVRRNPANRYRLFRRQDLVAFLVKVDSGSASDKPNPESAVRSAQGSGKEPSCSSPN